MSMTFRTSPLSRALLTAGLAVFALSGCTDAKRALGFEKKPPDEFAVVSRAPLSVPPEFKLRPPQPGATRPQEGSVRDQARETLIGGRAAPSVAGGSSGLDALLAKAGTAQADPDIRLKVDRETSALAKEDVRLTDRIIFWRDPEPPGTVIDAQKEAKRLREAQALGRAPTDGETPIIKRRKKGILEGIF
ncbi:MAG: DUF3035 domain-containing protein [Alphaproteobacteria bacterium]|nr:DUF3035 domain-containing protein [Alphaproteobacteria bacterium]